MSLISVRQMLGQEILYVGPIGTDFEKQSMPVVAEWRINGELRLPICPIKGSLEPYTDRKNALALGSP